MPHYSPQLVEQWTWVSSPLLSHTPLTGEEHVVQEEPHNEEFDLIKVASPSWLIGAKDGFSPSYTLCYYICCLLWRMYEMHPALSLKSECNVLSHGYGFANYISTYYPPDCHPYVPPSPPSRFRCSTTSVRMHCLALNSSACHLLLGLGVTVVPRTGMPPPPSAKHWTMPPSAQLSCCPVLWVKQYDNVCCL
jgi:hypothetical protein